MSSAANPKKNHTTNKLAALAIEAAPEKVSVSNDAIAALAYQKYQDRGCTHGFDQEDWAAAVAELAAKP